MNLKNYKNSGKMMSGLGKDIRDKNKKDCYITKYTNGYKVLFSDAKAPIYTNTIDNIDRTKFNLIIK